MVETEMLYLRRYIGFLTLALIVFLLLSFLEPRIHEVVSRTNNLILIMSLTILLGFLKYLMLGFALSPIYIFGILYVSSYISALIVIFENKLLKLGGCKLINVSTKDMSGRSRIFMLSNVLLVFGFMIVIFKIMTFNVPITPETDVYVILSYIAAWELTLNYMPLLMFVSVIITMQTLTTIRRYCTDITLKYPSSILSFIPTIIAGVGSLTSISLIFLSLFYIFNDVGLSILLTIYGLLLGLGPIIGFSIGICIPSHFFAERLIDDANNRFIRVLERFVDLKRVEITF